MLFNSYIFILFFCLYVWLGTIYLTISNYIKLELLFF